MLTLTLLGSGNSAMAPVYGCDCPACRRAQSDPAYRRQKTSAVVRYRGQQLLLDANAPDLLTRFPAGSIDRILLTHYHMDHVEQLFNLRWGVGAPVPIYGPVDEQGCDDLYKHPGCLQFMPGLTPFSVLMWQDLRITALPLYHSRPTLGYLFEAPGGRLAYLTDTDDLPTATLSFLQANPVDLLLMDCSYPPPADDTPARSHHNHLQRFCDLARRSQARRAGAIHIDHTLDAFLINQPYPLPDGLFLGHDQQEFTL